MPSFEADGNRHARRVAARYKRLGSKPFKQRTPAFIRVIKEMKQNKTIIQNILDGKFDWFLPKAEDA